MVGCLVALRLINGSSDQEEREPLKNVGEGLIAAVVGLIFAVLSAVGHTAGGRKLNV